jgi:hypothetical protein
MTDPRVKKRSRTTEQINTRMLSTSDAEHAAEEQGREEAFHLYVRHEARHGR